MLSGYIKTNPGPTPSSGQCFSICHWNLNSITAHNFAKLSLLTAYNLVHSFHIICLSETYLNSKTPPNETRQELPGYNLFRSDHLFFSIWVFFHEHSRFTGQQGQEEGIYLIPLYHFHPLHGHVDISRAIIAESSPLHIAGSRIRTGNLWFPSASR